MSILKTQLPEHGKHIRAIPLRQFGRTSEEDLGIPSVFGSAPAATSNQLIIDSLRFRPPSQCAGFTCPQQEPRAGCRPAFHLDQGAAELVLPEGESFASSSFTRASSRS